jgi:hypothetical protein
LSLARKRLQPGSVATNARSSAWGSCADISLESDD